MQLVYTPESSVGAWIKHRRQVLRSTQAEIATLVGCSVVLIRKIETDQRRPSPGIAERLGRALHIAPTETPDFCRALRSGNPGHLSSLTPEKSHSSVSHQAEPLPTPLALKAFPQPPHMIETLFGRDREIANICQRLKRGVRLLNLIGAPGVGKTQLALLTAQHMGAFYPQGILFVAGESLQNSQQLIAVLCKLLLHEPGHRRSMEALRKYWQQHPMLLILDSCEHISHIATMISELLRPPSQLQIVTTSQQLLHLVGEHVLPIAPLAVPIASSTAHPMIMEQQASMQLFAEHACAIQPAFALSEHYREITEIVRLLDGIPLALALAARRLRFYTPQQLLTQLRTDLLHELQDGAHDNPYHHQSWKAALDRSMTFLAKPIQNCFYRLSVFVGGWTLAMAEALCPSTDPAAILSMLQTLCDANLVFVDTQTQCEPRFRMLTPIRAYAAHKLSEEAEENIYRLRHAQIMLKIAAKTLSSHVPNNMAGCLQDEYDNLCAAIHWSHKAEQVILFAQFGITLFRGWAREGLREISIHWLSSIPFWVDDIPAVLRAPALLAIGALEEQRDHVQDAQHALEKSLALYQQLGDSSGIAEVRAHLGHIAYLYGDYPSAEANYAEALQHWQTLQRPDQIIETLIDSGELARTQGAVSQAQHYYHEALTLAQEHNNYTALALLATHQGLLARQQQLFEAAEAWHLQALALIERYQLPQNSDSMLALTELALMKGRLHEAVPYIKTCLCYTTRNGRTCLRARTILLCARMAYMAKKPLIALQLSAASSMLLRITGAPSCHPEYLSACDMIEELRTALTPDTFATVWSLAECMPFDDSIRLAKDVIETL